MTVFDGLFFAAATAICLIVFSLGMRRIDRKTRERMEELHPEELFDPTDTATPDADRIGKLIKRREEIL